MYLHFLSLFLYGAVFLPRKKVKREQRHMVFLFRLTPTVEESQRKEFRIGQQKYICMDGTNI